VLLNTALAGRYVSFQLLFRNPLDYKYFDEDIISGVYRLKASTYPFSIR
jgi:hypothetical protein